MLAAGVGIYSLVHPFSKESFNRFVYLGESLLLGSIIIVGEMMILSLLGLYTAWCLWGVVLLNFSFLFIKVIRQQFSCIFRSVNWDLSLAIFILLVGIFAFRNCYFLVDVDSHSTYLFAQKLWLENHSSLIGSPAVDVRIFVPHFNAVPYALGLSIFPRETLFAQLVVAFWTVVVLILVFGYVSHCLSRWHGLAAAMMVLFNDHMFYSGANQFVIVNSALIAFLFASVYNFWESRNTEKSFRFLLAVIFLLQILANKYQGLYAAIFIFLFGGILIQKNPVSSIKWILCQPKNAIFFVGGVIFLSLWYLKNFIITGVATFPILAGFFGAFGWTPEMASTFNNVYVGPLSPLKFLKYMSFMFVWPGVHPTKIVLIVICFLPLILALVMRRKKTLDEKSSQLFYWLAMSALIVFGFCLVNFVDPRVYRYGIAVLSIGAVFAIDYILREVFSIKNKVFIALIVLICSLPGYKIIYNPGVICKPPSMEDNLGVLLNKIHFSDIEKRYYPYNEGAKKAVKNNREKFLKAAWDTGVAGSESSLSAFLYPSAPQVGLWHTTVVKWDSYKSPKLIAADLGNSGIEWIMRVDREKNDLIFLSVDQYAQEAATYNLAPEEIYYNYGFPKELSRSH